MKRVVSKQAEEREVYMREKRSGFVYKRNLIGETRVSWLTGASWHPTKYAKRDVEFVDQATWELSNWAFNNRWRIQTAVGAANPEQLKKIAEIVGYKEPE